MNLTDIISGDELRESMNVHWPHVALGTSEWPEDVQIRVREQNERITALRVPLCEWARAEEPSDQSTREAMYHAIDFTLKMIDSAIAEASDQKRCPSVCPFGRR
jgi:hypothetical protein